MHNPVDRAEQDVDTGQFYNLIEHNWYLKIKNTLLIFMMAAMIIFMEFYLDNFNN